MKKKNMIALNQCEKNKQNGGEGEITLTNFSYIQYRFEKNASCINKYYRVCAACWGSWCVN